MSMVNKNADEDKEIKKDERDWASLPICLLEMISSHLYTRDTIRFRLACKSWQGVTTPLRSIPPLIQPQWFEPFPWLMCPSRYNTSDRFNLFHPMSNETYVMNIPELVGAVIRCSNFGWLLMSENNCSLFFFNPFTRAIINLPDLDHMVYFVGMCFTKPPTSADCKIFGLRESYMNKVIIYTCYHGEDIWTRRTLASNISFEAECWTNPIFYQGSFYCLDVHGRLGVFNPEKDDWTVQQPKVIHGSYVSDHMNFLAECNGQLVTLVVGHLGNPICIFRLDSSNVNRMRWIEMKSLGERTIYIGQGSCLLIPARTKGTENKIYFPRFRDKDNYVDQNNRSSEGLFYSLQTGKFHSYGIISSLENWQGTIPKPDCIWIEPNFEVADEQELQWWDDDDEEEEEEDDANEEEEDQ